MDRTVCLICGAQDSAIQTRDVIVCSECYSPEHIIFENDDPKRYYKETAIDYNSKR